ncbi:MAG: 4-alpha-glucanotransferase, partial [Clostridia bacterium]|nr:4-alpha-glucanotransferase [Clostridia bacterium]
MKRKSGILMHPSSLYGEYSIGSFGRAAFELCDFLYESGFSVWQTLPFCMTDEFNSPYRSPASFSLNPYFIDLDILYEEGYLSKDEISYARQKNEYRCELERLSVERMPLLFIAARRAMSDAFVRGRVFDFISENPRIGAVSVFLSQRSPITAEPCEAEALWQFLHYEFFRQWQAVKRYANQRGIEIMGDLPIYVSPDSADVWEKPSLFLLDGAGYPTRLAGVPPDYFSPGG